jgi:hypothetical protein
VRGNKNDSRQPIDHYAQGTDMNVRRLTLLAMSLALAGVAVYAYQAGGISTIGSRDRRSAGVFLGVLDNVADTSEGLNLPTGRVLRPGVSARMEAAFSRDSGCWWLWQLFTGIDVCW